jgi:hypothetical protein
MAVRELSWADERSKRSRRSWRRARRLFKAILLLTLPFYCLGFTALGMLRLRTLISHVATSPLLLGGLLFALLLVLLEPWTGVVSNGCAVGAKCAAAGVADPAGCTLILALLVVLAGVLWFLL